MKMSLFVSVFCCATSYAIMAQAVCTPAPDCASLGYTKTSADCEGKIAVKCPTDTSKVFCKVIEIGSILYGDGTVTRELLRNKTPIGVVFDTDNRLAVALTDVKEDGTVGTEAMHWTGGPYDIPNLENCTDITAGTELVSFTCGIDGRANTDKILSCTWANCFGTPAAKACNLYEPAGCTKDFCKNTKWFLPSLRDLQNMYINKNLLNSTLSASGGKTLNFQYWSSTEYNYNSAWRFVTNSLKEVNSKNRLLNYVRPVVAY